MLKEQHHLDRIVWPTTPSPGDLIAPIASEILHASVAYCEQGNEVKLEAPLNDATNISDVKTWFSTFKTQLQSAPGAVCFRAGAQPSEASLRFIFSLASSAFGRLNDRYGVMFDVKDRGLDHTRQAVAVSKTNAATGIHTDSTDKKYSPDIIGLLCLRPSKSGGESLLCNAANLYCWMERNYPDDIETLSTPIIRDLITPGTKSTPELVRNNKFPVFALDKIGLKMRYMRFWIEKGYEKSNTLLPPQLRKALDRIDFFFADPENVCSFNLKRGDMLFVNNRFLCHGRNAFEDHSAPGKKRIFVRTWIDSFY